FQEEIIKQLEDTDSGEGLARHRLNAARLSIKTLEFEKAGPYLTAALEYFRMSNNQVRVAEALRVWSEFELRSGRTGGAVAKLNEASNVYENLGLTNELAALKHLQAGIIANRLANWEG